MQRILRPLLASLGWFAVALGAIGLFVPLLPTTPFLILAAWCFDRSSPRLHAWLLRQPLLGPLLCDWRAHGVIRLRAKVASTALLLAFAAVPVLKGNVPPWALFAMAAVIAAVLAFIWSRPAHPTPRAEHTEPASIAAPRSPAPAATRVALDDAAASTRGPVLALERTAAPMATGHAPRGPSVQSR